MLQLLGRTGGIDLHSSVVFISDPAPQPDLSCTFFNEPTESDTLYASRDKPSAGLNQRAGSRAPVFFGASRTDSIALRRLFTVKGLLIR